MSESRLVAYLGTSVDAHEDAMRDECAMFETQCVLYAENKDQAVEMAREILGEAVYEYEDTLEVVRYPEADHFASQEYVPRQEMKGERLRELGFMEAGESLCEWCDLYACGLDEYEVCRECGVCRDCGCICPQGWGLKRD